LKDVDKQGVCGRDSGLFRPLFVVFLLLKIRGGGNNKNVILNLRSIDN